MIAPTIAAIFGLNPKLRGLIRSANSLIFSPFWKMFLCYAGLMCLSSCVAKKLWKNCPGTGLEAVPHYLTKEKSNVSPAVILLIRLFRLFFADEIPHGWLKFIIGNENPLCRFCIFNAHNPSVLCI